MCPGLGRVTHVATNLQIAEAFGEGNFAEPTGGALAANLDRNLTDRESLRSPNIHHAGGQRGDGSSTKKGLDNIVDIYGVPDVFTFSINRDRVTAEGHSDIGPEKALLGQVQGHAGTINVTQTQHDGIQSPVV